jgi:1-acyl-sn-glycerol-3-phosphate acyltransferase
MIKWSLGYELLRTYVRFGFWLTHKRIVVAGRELIPKNKPVIFAPNHQNALMDPLAVVCTNPLQSVWLARADIFKSKAVLPILRFTKLLPVYRIRDGKNNLSNNEEIFNQVVQVLESKQSVALFPEAAHSGKRQMLPHKKAIPRIALEAEEKNNFEIELRIVPVGIYYSHYWLFNRTLVVQYGKPIEVDRYKAEYAENPQKAMLSLRDEIHRKLSPLVLQINSEKYYSEYENLRQLAGKAYSKTRFFSKNRILRRLYAEQELIARIERLEIEKPQQFRRIIEESTNYINTINELHLTDEQVGKAGKAHWTGFVTRLLAILFTFPLFAFGFLFNALPFFIPRKILRSKVKDIAFLSTFNFVAGLILFPVSYLIEAAFVFVFTGSEIISLVTFILMPFIGKIAFNLLVFYKEVLYNLKLMIGYKINLKQITSQRKQLIGLILNGIGEV